MLPGVRGMAGSKPTVLRPAAGLFPAPSRSAANDPDRGNTRKHLGPPPVWWSGLLWKSSPSAPPHHGSAHDSKPLPPPPGICLPARSLRPRQEDHRSGRTAAARYGGGLFRMSQAGAGLRSPSRAALRVYSSLGHFGFLLVPHAARQLPRLRRSGRRGLVGRWQASVDQSLYVVSGPLGAQA